MSRATFDGGGKVGAHSHTEFSDTVLPGDDGKKFKMRLRILLYRRDTHQTSNDEVKPVPANSDEIRSIFRIHSGLLCLAAGVYLNEKL